jgi:hypothetical protein
MVLYPPCDYFLLNELLVLCFGCRKAGGKLVRSKELFSLEAGGFERIEDYNSAKSSSQQESDEEAAVYKLTTFNLGRYRRTVLNRGVGKLK